MPSKEERCCLLHMDLCALVTVSWGDCHPSAQEHFSLVLAVSKSTVQAVGSALAQVLPASIAGS